MSTIKLHRAVCALLLLLASATGKAQNLALKTNLLYDAVLIPNIGVEVSLGKQWTASADWFYTWFSSDNRHRYWQGYGGYLYHGDRPPVSRGQTPFYVAFQIFGSFLFLINVVNQLLTLL